MDLSLNYILYEYNLRLLLGYIFLLDNGNYENVYHITCLDNTSKERNRNN